MKKSLLFLSLTLSLFADVYTDIGITIGNNDFDDPEILKAHKTFIGLRTGYYKDHKYGVQVGFEAGKNVNCQNLDLKRFYINGLRTIRLNEKLDIYGMVIAGYEISNIQHFKPNQLIYGLGAGAKYRMVEDFDTFVEVRQLKRSKSKDTDTISTLGISYRFVPKP